MAWPHAQPGDAETWTGPSTAVARGTVVERTGWRDELGGGRGKGEGFLEGKS